MRRIILWGVLFGTVCTLSGIVYEALGSWQDARRFPQLGHSVRVGESNFNLNCFGKGSPTVILDSGLGLPSLAWFRIQPEISKFTRVCSYDRAGYGWSDRAGGSRTSLHLAEELKLLLTAADENGPYILVGPSFGGFIARVFTGLYPNDVRGLVFLDASHEDQQERIDEIVPATRESRLASEASEQLREQEALRLLKLTIPLGIERLQNAVRSERPGSTFGLPENILEEFQYLNRQLKTREAILAESIARKESGKLAKDAGTLGDRPTIVLTGGKMEFTTDAVFTLAVQEELRNLWINTLQVEEAHLSTRGRQVVLKDSGHVIQFERPDAVIEAIREIWAEVRASL